MTLPRGLRIVGFTLVELLVVLVVLAVATSLITVSVSAASGHVLEGAGEQLAASLEEARWQAISTGRRIAFETPAGQAPLWHEQLADGTWRTRMLPAGAADAYPPGVTLQVAATGNATAAPARIVLGPEPVGAGACVQISHEGAHLAVVSDGIAPFAVRRGAGC
jgi:general secretion pathway protein H